MRAALRLGLCLGVAGLSLGLSAAQSIPAAGSTAPRDSSRVSLPAAPAAVAPAPAGTASDSTLKPYPVIKPDSLALRPKSRSDTVVVVKHRFNHREQIITGSVIMTCLALMMVAMNNYNPR